METITEVLDDLTAKWEFEHLKEYLVDARFNSDYLPFRQVMAVAIKEVNKRLDKFEVVS